MAGKKNPYWLLYRNNENKTVSLFKVFKNYVKPSSGSKCISFSVEGYSRFYTLVPDDFPFSLEMTWYMSFYTGSTCSVCNGHYFINYPIDWMWDFDNVIPTSFTLISNQFGVLDSIL